MAWVDCQFGEFSDAPVWVDDVYLAPDPGRSRPARSAEEHDGTAGRQVVSNEAVLSWIATAALAAPLAGVVVPDRAAGDQRQVAAPVSAAQVAAIEAAVEERSGARGCDGPQWTLLAPDPAGDEPQEVRVACLYALPGARAALEPVVAAVEQQPARPWRVVLPVEVSVERLQGSGLDHFVLDPGRPVLEIDVRGTVRGWREAELDADDVSDVRMLSLLETLGERHPLVVASSSSGHGGSTGDLQDDTDHQEIYLPRGTDLAPVRADVRRLGGRIGRRWVPRRWTALVLLDTADAGEAEQAVRAALPEAIEVGPW